MTSEHLNSTSAANKLNISIDELAELREQGLISAEKKDDDWHYSLISLEAYLAQIDSEVANDDAGDSQSKLASDLLKDSDSLPEYSTKPGSIDSSIFQAPESAELDALDGTDSSQFKQEEPSSRLSDEYREISPDPEESFDSSELDSDIHSETENEDSALILGDELDVDSDGATMIHSSQQMEETFAQEFDAEQEDEEVDSGIELVSDPAEDTIDNSGITLDSESEVVAVEEDSGITLGESGLIADEASAIVLDEESGIILDGDEDSGITLDNDSGVALEMTSVLDEDSDPSLADGDSGIALEPIDDSGIALEEAMVVDDEEDSGIALLAEDSGIALDTATDSDIEAIDAPEGTQRMVSPYAEPEEDELELEALDEEVEMDATSRLENPFEQENEFASMEDSASDVQLSEGPVSEEMEILDESGEYDEFEEEGLDLEEPEYFDEAGDLLDEDELSGEFGSETSGASSVDMKLAPPTPQTYVKAPEAEWGAMAFVGLLASVLILVANGVVAWQGLRTLQTGDVKPAPTDSIVDMILNLF